MCTFLSTCGMCPWDAYYLWCACGCIMHGLCLVGACHVGCWVGAHHEECNLWVNVRWLLDSYHVWVRLMGTYHVRCAWWVHLTWGVPGECISCVKCPWCVYTEGNSVGNPVGNPRANPGTNFGVILNHTFGKFSYQENDISFFSSRTCLQYSKKSPSIKNAKGRKNASCRGK